MDDLRTTQHEINRVAEYIFDEGHHHVLPGEGLRVTGRFVGDASPRYVIDNGPGVGGGGGGMEGLYEEVQTLLGNCVRLFYEADDLLKRSRSENGRWDPEGLRRRVVFVMNRHEVAEKMVRLGDQKKKLADVQMGLFMRYVVISLEPVVVGRKISVRGGGDPLGKSTDGWGSRKNAVQDVMLKQIAESVKELQRQNSSKSQTSGYSEATAP